MSLGVGHDEAHLGTILIIRLWTSDLHIGEGNEPACRDGGGINTVHDAAEESCRIGATYARDVHNIRIGGIGGSDVPRRDGIGHDIELLETTHEVGLLTILELLVTARSHNLHIHTSLVELHEFVT